MATSAQVRDEILAGKWDETLGALYGGGAAELRRQRARYAAALEQFELYFGPGRQVRLYSAPGRTELGGNHTDHQHGYGLAAAVTLDLIAVASPSDDGFIRVKSRGFNKLDVIDLSEPEPQQGESTHSASLIRGIAEGFRALGKETGGFDAYTASDVLRGSGLSSSAAFEMGMAVVLNGEYGCGLSGPEMAKICQYAENTYFGKPCGLLDQLTSAVAASSLQILRTPVPLKLKKSTRRVCCRGGYSLRDRYPGQPQRADRGIRGHSPGNGGCGGLSGPECAGAGAGNSILAGAAPAAHAMRGSGCPAGHPLLSGKRPGAGPEECPATRRLCGVSASHPGKWPFLV